MTALAWAAIGESRAAGGHFAVDDAALLEVGECQVETWVELASGRATLLHAGPACRVGAVEIGLDGDRLRVPGERSAITVGPQIKWARAIDERTSVGVVALAGWNGRSGRYVGAGVYAPVTLRVADGVWLHANAGRDWSADAPPAARVGVAIDWQAAPAWLLTGEVFRQAHATVGRLGVRWQPSAAFNVDSSWARGIGASACAWWTIGASWTFARPSR
ncbi:MAG: hypothetical protein ACXWVF_05465 [Telluria sp.]